MPSAVTQTGPYYTTSYSWRSPPECNSCVCHDARAEEQRATVGVDSDLKYQDAVSVLSGMLSDKTQGSGSEAYTPRKNPPVRDGTMHDHFRSCRRALDFTDISTKPSVEQQVDQSVDHPVQTSQMVHLGFWYPAPPSSPQMMPVAQALPVAQPPPTPFPSPYRAPQPFLYAVQPTSQCNASAAQAVSALSIVTSKQSPRKYMCSHAGCFKTFGSHDALRKHARHKHLGKPTPTISVRCRLCTNKTVYHSMDAMRKHLRVHHMAETERLGRGKTLTLTEPCSP